MKHETRYEVLIVVSVVLMFAGFIPAGMFLLLGVATYSSVKLGGKLLPRMKAAVRQAKEVIHVIQSRRPSSNGGGFQFGESRR